jgi:hypothetical protein
MEKNYSQKSHSAINNFVGLARYMRCQYKSQQDKVDYQNLFDQSPILIHDQKPLWQKLPKKPCAAFIFFAVSLQAAFAVIGRLARRGALVYERR